MIKKNRNNRKTLEFQGLIMGFNVYYSKHDPFYDLDVNIPIKAGDRWYSRQHGKGYQIAVTVHPELRFSGRDTRWAGVCSRTFFNPTIKQIRF